LPDHHRTGRAKTYTQPTKISSHAAISLSNPAKLGDNLTTRFAAPTLLFNLAMDQIMVKQPSKGNYFPERASFNEKHPATCHWQITGSPFNK